MPRRPHRSFHRSRSSARSMEAGEVPSTRSSSMPAASFSGVWPPRLTMTPTSRPSPTRRGPLGLDDVGQVLGGERLEVEAVGGVVVGRDRLGVAVDHDGLEPGVAQGHRGVHAAVVELDALADPVRPRPEDDDPGPVRRADLVLVLVGRVVVRRVGLELGRAGVDRLEGDRRPRRPPGPPGRRPRTPRRPGGGPAARRRSRGA